MVSWSIVCLDKRKGGLGYGNLSLLNKAFLCKWSWCFAKQNGAFWRQVINRKYREEERGWCSSEVRGAYRVGLWKTFKKEGDSLSCKITFLVRNGRRVRFWKDKWCGDELLCIYFPYLL